MGAGSEGSDAGRLAGRVERGFEMDEVAGAEAGGVPGGVGGVQVHGAQAVQARVQGDHAVDAVVAAAEGDDARGEAHEQRVEGCEAAAVGYDVDGEAG